jgi:hypothetical protein
MVVCARGERGGAILDESSTSLPSFRSRDDGETLHTSIIYYNYNKCSVKISCGNIASRAPPSRLIKASGLGIMAFPRRVR